MLNPDIEELHKLAADTGSQEVLEALLQDARIRASIAHEKVCELKSGGGLSIRQFGWEDKRAAAHAEVDNLLRLLGRIK